MPQGPDIMAAIKSNKLIPLLAIVALVIVGYVAVKATGGEDAVQGDTSPLEAVPATAPASQPTGGLLGGVKDARDSAAHVADADSPSESLKTLTAEVIAMRSQMQTLGDTNRTLMAQRAQSTVDRQQIKDELLSELRQSGGTTGASGASPLTLDASASGSPSSTSKLGKFLDPATLAELPADFGFDTPSGAKAARGAGTDSASVTTPAMSTSSPPRSVYPMGVSVERGRDGKDALVRKVAGVPTPIGRHDNTTEASATILDGQSPLATQGKKKDKRYFTIPENATLMGVTAMTAIVGRIPVDGKVTDPMQFKAILGPENLAANGHFLPQDLAGVVVSGIAIGDLNLQCSEGLIQSLTFIFNDGTIQTVSQRQNGITPNARGSGASSNSGLATTAKLGYLSDRYGNPCISGVFITNAPAYLTDTIGLKSLSIAGQAYAQAQTTTTTSTGFGGASSSSAITGDIGKYVLGKTVGGATDEVSSWLMKRLGNSFDAIVTVAGADVVVNIDQEIPIDKTVGARRIDYGRIDSANQSNGGSANDFD
jgi:integrating conjugative element protein (TIGR03752 family)